jgi:hypothetical protein
MYPARFLEISRLKVRIKAPALASIPFYSDVFSRLPPLQSWNVKSVFEANVCIPSGSLCYVIAMTLAWRYNCCRETSRYSLQGACAHANLYFAMRYATYYPVTLLNRS